MTEEDHSSAGGKTLLIIELTAFLLVCMISYVQLSIFNKMPDPRIWGRAISLLTLGMFLDTLMLLFAVCQFFIRKSSSIIPGIGWLAYFLSTLSYSNLLFLNVNTTNTLIISFLKGVEFFILSCFHFLCMFLAGHLAKKREHE